jgi:hypothetical protein
MMRLMSSRSSISWPWARALRSLQHAGPAEHRVERRAQLVRERGQEFVLQGAEPFGLVARGALAREQVLALGGGGARDLQHARVGLQARIEQGCQQRESKHAEGRDHHQGRQPAVIDAAPRGHAHAVQREAGGGHAGVVHADDGRTHHHRRADPRQPHLRHVMAQAEGDPQRQAGGRDGDDHRQREQPRVVDDARLHAHGGHAGVVHGVDADAHHQGAGGQALPSQLGAADLPQRQAGGADRQQQRHHGQRQVEGDRDRQAEGQHADEVHGPDARAHGDGTADDPGGDGAAARFAHAAGEAERRVGCGDRNQDGNQHQRCFVMSSQHCKHPSGD